MVVLAAQVEALKKIRRHEVQGPGKQKGGILNEVESDWAGWSSRKLKRKSSKGRVIPQRGVNYGDEDERFFLGLSTCVLRWSWRGLEGGKGTGRGGRPVSKMAAEGKDVEVPIFHPRLRKEGM